MDFTILNTIPLSGTAPEFFFGDRQGEIVWIQFNEIEGGKWFGAFEPGKLIEDRIKIEETEDELRLLINGNFYRVNKFSKECLTKLTNSDILDFKQFQFEDQFVFIEQTGISVLDSSNQKSFKVMNWMIEAKILSIDNNEIEILTDLGEGNEKIKSQLPTI